MSYSILYDNRGKDVRSVLSGRLGTGFIQPFFNLSMNKRLNITFFKKQWQNRDMVHMQNVTEINVKRAFYKPEPAPLAWCTPIMSCHSYKFPINACNCSNPRAKQNQSVVRPNYVFLLSGNFVQP